MTSEPWFACWATAAAQPLSSCGSHSPLAVPSSLQCVRELVAFQRTPFILLLVSPAPPFHYACDLRVCIFKM
ncbi:hypothetical protein B0H14DRAFT_2940831 [Mycena olivaceomarginata]|nr:hypothetical protein B0H14DRAFT_2940831 [Mycena olivaceomarginata]